MAERLNIWGKRGCTLPNGNLCYACCELLHVPLDHTYFKPQNSPCTSQISFSGRPGGCNLHKLDKPDSCLRFCCDKISSTTKIDLIGAAYSLGTITIEDALKAARKITTDPNIHQTILKSAKSFKGKRAVRPIETTTIETI